ncbi:MAG: tetratricopeptide repeat protein [Candidatus Eremiobacteraeota bacterium]|nr:tetratricopeptide repeat protein [Candidatus Eremiobacteraeota bacterium]
MNKKIAALIVLLVFCAVIGARLESMQLVQNRIQAGSSSTQMLLSLLGELRYTLAAFIWLKTEFYHHEYEFTQKDWRQNEPLMPLIRLVTLLDPHFVQAYDFGGYHLAVNLKKPDEALNFLHEGIEHNPQSFELLWETGYILYQEKKYREAIPYLLQALPLWRQSSSMDNVALKEIWVVSRIAHSYWELGEYQNAEKYLREWLTLAPMANWPVEKLKEIEAMKKSPKK